MTFYFNIILKYNGLLYFNVKFVPKNALYVSQNLLYNLKMETLHKCGPNNVSFLCLFNELYSANERKLWARGEKHCSMLGRELVLAH